MKATEPLLFDDAAAFEDWLCEHHATSPARWLLLAKKGHAGLTHREALDLALCWGWIDGFVSKWDENHYALRFSPRLPRSNWSAVNIARFAELQQEGRVKPAGLAVFAGRDLQKSEERPADLPPALLKRFPKEAKAFWLGQPPGYRRQASWWILSAKKEETRERRLLQLIEDCAAGRRVKAVPG